MLFTNEVQVIDVSNGGIFVKADRRFEIGREYSVKLEYEDKVLSLHGIVAWSALSERGEGSFGRTVPIYKAGIRFADISMEKLNELIAHMGSAMPDGHESEQVNRTVTPGVQRVAPKKTVLKPRERYRLKKISLRGLLIESERELAIEATLPMELSLLGKRSIGLLGRVAYCLKGEAEGASLYHIGIDFIDMSERDREKLRGFLSLIERKDGSSSCFVTVQPA